MKKFIVLLSVLAVAGILQAETYTGLVVSKNGTAVIADPSSPNQTFVNVMMSSASTVLPYEGKIVEISGQLNPDRAFPTLQTIDSIKEVGAQ